MNSAFYSPILKFAFGVFMQCSHRTNLERYECVLCISRRPREFVHYV